MKLQKHSLTLRDYKLYDANGTAAGFVTAHTPEEGILLAKRMGVRAPMVGGTLHAAGQPTSLPMQGKEVAVRQAKQGSR